MKRDYVPVLLENLIWLILVAVFLFFSLQSPFFLTSVNITNILSAAAVLGDDPWQQARRINKGEVLGSRRSGACQSTNDSTTRRTSVSGLHKSGDGFPSARTAICYRRTDNVIGNVL